jgi:superoxide dismutase, Fe-Mn family
MNRRRVLYSLAAIPVLGLSVPTRAQSARAPISVPGLKLLSQSLELDAFKLPALGYGFDVLEPHIDTATMQLHHGRHHAAFVSNLVNLQRELPQDWTLGELAGRYVVLPANLQTPVRNNAGGHLNHALFWRLLRPGGSPKPVGQSAALLRRDFGSFEGFQKSFSATATSRFGSGWAWLTISRDGALSVSSTPNQDSPLSEGVVPLLGLDVWEHAYYLKYQNRRGEYVQAFWNLVNWDEVERNYRRALEVLSAR